MRAQGATTAARGCRFRVVLSGARAAARAAAAPPLLRRAAAAAGRAHGRARSNHLCALCHPSRLLGFPNPTGTQDTSARAAQGTHLVCGLQPTKRIQHGVRLLHQARRRVRPLPCRLAGSCDDGPRTRPPAEDGLAPKAPPFTVRRPRRDCSGASGGRAGWAAHGLVRLACCNSSRRACSAFNRVQSPMQRVAAAAALCAPPCSARAHDRARRPRSTV
jgi:cytochrome c5